MTDLATPGLSLCALTRLAEHLAARRLGDWDDVKLVADWLDYSLNRCGLVVVEEQSLARPTLDANEGVVEELLLSLVEPITKAVLFDDCGDTLDWKGNTGIGIAAVNAIRPAIESLASVRLGVGDGELVEATRLWNERSQ